MGHGNKLKVILVFVVLVWMCSADCNDVTISDGNYYDMSNIWFTKVNVGTNA